MKQIVIILISIIYFPFGINAQNEISRDKKGIEYPKGKIFLTSKNTGKKIILRWAPGDPGTWHLSNKYGYILEKLAFKDSTDFFTAQYKPLVSNALKPWPLNDWAKIANEAANDKYAAIAAQAIYGERNKSNPENIDADFWEKANELENIYGMCLLSADFSANAAIASALRFEDDNIDTAFTYIYRVYSLANSDKNPIDTAYLVVKGNIIEQEIQIKIENVYESENAIKISWDRMYNDYFSGYYIEKSTDGGKSYFRLNKSPYIDSPVNKNGVTDEMNEYTDSVNQNYVKYYYRIIGINTFAEYSIPSKPIIAMGRDKTPPEAPINIKAKEIAKNKMLIKWEVLNESSDLKGFLISRSEGIKGMEIALTTELLPTNTRSFIDTSYNETLSNWYYVYAVDTAGNANVGFPQYGSIVDSIAPAPPTGLTGIIDSNGIVNISWKLGKEKDIYGYKIYFANQADHTFIGLNNIPLRDTSFIDTIPLNVLTEDIFYRVAAIDMARNISEFSGILKVKKPDIVPPVAPIFTDYKVTKDGIKLKWAMSSSKDVKTHYLYRREKGLENWEMIYRTSKVEDYDQFVDSGTIPDKTYEYKIIAEDDADLLSDISFIITLTAIDFSEILPINDIEASFNKTNKEIIINWHYPIEGDLNIQIFRAINGSSFHFIKKVSINKTQIIDNDISIGNLYEYNVNVINNSKNESGFSPIVKVDLTEKK